MSPPNYEWSAWMFNPNTGGDYRTRMERNGEIITEYSQPANPTASARPGYANPQQSYHQLAGSANSYHQLAGSTGHPNYFQPTQYQYSSERTNLGHAGYSSTYGTSRSTFPATSPPFDSSSWQQNERNYTHLPHVANVQAVHQRYQGQSATDNHDIYSLEDRPSSGATQDRTDRVQHQLNQGSSPSETGPSQEVDSASEALSEYSSEDEISNEIASYAETAPQPKFDSSNLVASETEFASGNQDEEEVRPQISSHSGLETPRPLPYLYPPPNSGPSVDISYHQPSAAFSPNPTSQITRAFADVTVSRTSGVRDRAEPELPRQRQETRYISSKRIQDRVESRVGSLDNSFKNALQSRDESPQREKRKSGKLNKAIELNEKLMKVGARRQRDSSRYRHTEPEPPIDKPREKRSSFSYGSFRPGGEGPSKRHMPIMPPPTTEPVPAGKGSNQLNKLDKSYQVCPSSDFRKRRVFKILWSEPAGDNNCSAPSREENPEAPSPSELKFGEKVYQSIRRFVVVRARKGHCLCLPIFTYGGQGTLKPGVKPNDHAIIYTGRKVPELLKNEKRLRKRAIRVVGSTDRDKLDPASRLNYAKVYTVEHNVKVCFIGKIHKDSEAAFDADFKNTFDEDDELRSIDGALRDLN